MPALGAAVRMHPRTLTVISGGLSSTPFAPPDVRPIDHAPPVPEPESKTFFHVVSVLVVAWVASVAVTYTGLLAVGIHAVPR